MTRKKKATAAKRAEMMPPVPFALHWCDARLAMVLPISFARKLIYCVAALELAAWLLIETIRALRDAAPIVAIVVNIALGLTGVVLNVLYPGLLVLFPFLTLISFFGRPEGKYSRATRSLFTTTVLLALNWKIYDQLRPLLSLYGFWEGVR